MQIQPKTSCQTHGSTAKQTKVRLFGRKAASLMNMTLWFAKLHLNEMEMFVHDAQQHIWRKRGGLTSAVRRRRAEEQKQTAASFLLYKFLHLGRKERKNHVPKMPL